jgi:hypothetical protein
MSLTIHFGPNDPSMQRLRDTCSLQPVVAGRRTGLRDMDGIELFDGDTILDFNSFVEGEDWDVIRSGVRKKIGAPSVVRLNLRNRWCTVTPDGAVGNLECGSSDPVFGVRKVFII